MHPDVALAAATRPERAQSLAAAVLFLCAEEIFPPFAITMADAADIPQVFERQDAP